MSIITTAGDNRESIAYELHQKAQDILDGKREDYTFYPVIYSLGMDEDWRDEKNWYKVNPSLGYTIKVEGMREACHEAEQNPADEITFRWLRLNQWVGSTIAWIPDSVVMKGQTAVFRDDELRGRKCYGGLDLSSSEDITALALVFPPESEDEKYMLKLFCWVPEDTVPKREKRTGLPYSKWVAQGSLETTPGNVIDYAYIHLFFVPVLPVEIKREIVSSIGRYNCNDEIYDFITLEAFNTNNPMDLIYQMFRTCLYKSREDKRFDDLRQRIITYYNNEVINKANDFYNFKDKQRAEKLTVDNQTINRISKPMLLIGDAEDTLSILPDNSVQLIFTSPPYYNAKEYSDYNSYEAYLAKMKMEQLLAL